MNLDKGGNFNNENKFIMKRSERIKLKFNKFINLKIVLNLKLLWKYLIFNIIVNIVVVVKI